MPIIRHRLWFLLVIVLLVAAACGTNDESASGGGGGDGGDGGGEQSTGGGGQASGDVTVWAMGAEGESLGSFAKQFEQQNGDVSVNVTPIAWDVAHDTLVTSVGGRQPDAGSLAVGHHLDG